MYPEPFSPLERARELRGIYSAIPENEGERIMEGIADFLGKCQAPRESIDSFIEEAAKMIYRRFEFKEIAIGLKDVSDGLFKYRVLVGFTKSAEIARRKIVYTPQDMRDDAKFPSIKVSRVTEISTAGMTDDERDTYSRPSLLIKPRTSPDEFKEGDYLDIFLHGDKGAIIGWMELSNPITGKLPSRSTVKWLELIASIIARVAWEREYCRPL